MKKHLQITDPEQDAKIGIQPIIRWHPIIALPDINNYKLILVENDNRKEFIFNGSSEVTLPVHLSVGASCRVRIECASTDGQVFASSWRRLHVDPQVAFPNAIHCPQAWGQTFIGNTRANPCCNLKPGSGFAIVKGEKQEFHNSPNMIALRESLLRGSPRFCDPGCRVLKTNDNAQSTGELNPSQVKAMKDGALTLSHPPLVKISLGSYCNHACTFCMKIQVEEDWKQDLSLFDYILDHASGINRLTLTGGEPLVFIQKALPHLEGILEKNPHIRLFLMTNGALLRKLAPVLMRFEHLDMQVSLNASSAESYLRVHRKDDFNEVCEGIKLVKKSRPQSNIRLKMVYMRSNIGDVEHYPALAHELGADSVMFSNMTYLRKADAPESEQFKIGDPDWVSAASSIEAATRQLDGYGIEARWRRPGDKRSETLEDE